MFSTCSPGARAGACASALAWPAVLAAFRAACSAFICRNLLPRPDSDEAVLASFLEGTAHTQHTLAPALPLLCRRPGRHRQGSRDALGRTQAWGGGVWHAHAGSHRAASGVGVLRTGYPGRLQVFCAHSPWLRGAGARRQGRGRRLLLLQVELCASGHVRQASRDSGPHARQQQPQKRLLQVRGSAATRAPALLLCLPDSAGTGKGRKRGPHAARRGGRMLPHLLAGAEQVVGEPV